MPFMSRLKMILLGIAVFGLSLAGISKIATHVYESQKDNQRTAYTKWGSTPKIDERWISEKATYDFIAVSPGAWDSPSMQEAKIELQRQNLDILIGSYISAFTSSQWTKDAYDRNIEGFLYDWWEATSPYLAYTTECDTAAIFKNNYVFDVFNPECRTAVIGVMNDYIVRNDLDWIMLDFISVPIPNLKKWQDPIWEEMELGDLDFDQNGIGHWDDREEQRQLRTVWDLYIEEMRDTFPSDLLIIPNGGLSIKDPLFSALVDGCYVEGFPQWFFGTAEANYTNALDPEYFNSLWILANPDRWRTPRNFVMIEDRYDRGTFGYISMMFDNVVELKRMRGEITDTPLPIMFDTGPPLGPAVFSVEAIIRPFEKGNMIILHHTDNSPVYSWEPNN